MATRRSPQRLKRAVKKLVVGATSELLAPSQAAGTSAGEREWSLGLRIAGKGEFDPHGFAVNRASINSGLTGWSHAFSSGAEISRLEGSVDAKSAFCVEHQRFQYRAGCAIEFQCRSLRGHFQVQTLAAPYSGRHALW